MDRYDTIMARAHEIAERELQRRELDGESDLLVLEGSEQGGSSQGGQDGQVEMDGIEIGGGSEIQSAIRADSEVQGPVFSPRKTRLGQVVGYNGKK
jgi:hypothetical protein